MYGVSFGIVSYHKALQSVLKSNKGNKTYFSRLTRWVDRLLPFDFAFVHTPGRTLGMARYPDTRQNTKALFKSGTIF